MIIPDKINDPEGYLRWWFHSHRILKLIEDVPSRKLNGTYIQAMEIILNYYRHPESFGIFGEASIKEIAEPYIISRRELDKTGGKDLVFNGSIDDDDRYEYVRDFLDYTCGRAVNGVSGVCWEKAYMTSREICDDLLYCTQMDRYPFVDMMGETICGGVMFYPALIDILMSLMFFEKEFDPFEWRGWLINHKDWSQYGSSRERKWAIVKVRWTVTVDSLLSVGTGSVIPRV